MKKSKLIAKLIAKGFMTGSTKFFGLGDDIDYVVRRSQVSEKCNVALRKFKSCGSVPEDAGMTCYKVTSEGVIFNFIIVDDELYRCWAMATMSASKCIKYVPEFKEWFKHKPNRQEFFAAFRYQTLEIRAREGIPND